MTTRSYSDRSDSLSAASVAPGRHRQESGSTSHQTFRDWQSTQRINDMAEISRGALFGKLNKLAFRGIESATVFCKLRGNPYVELVHWIHQILQLQDSDLHRIVKQFNLNPSNLARDITDALDRLPRGSSSISDLSSNVEEAVERGWVFATLMFAEVVGGSPEDGQSANDGFRMGGGAAPGEASAAMSPAQMGKQEALAQFTIDLTEQARNGKMDPIVGRDDEIRQLVDILMRRSQNNPMLVGEAGVGKTAVIEGFAMRIAIGDVPPPLKDVQLRALDVGLLQAGASMKGEFENRLKQVIEEVQSSTKPIILFIDEAHTLVGAGGAAGTGDAANLLKPALARGNLRTIGATTWAEYKKHIEKDPALTRRFQTVQIDEPSEEKAILMMRGVASVMEKHHKVQILDEALEAAVKLSHRYIPARQLPDKSVSLLDTACARVAISQHAVPAEVDDTRKRIQALETELGIIAREKNVGVNVSAREDAANEKLATQKARLETLEANWITEKELVERILDIRSKLRGSSAPVEGTGSALEESVEQVAEAEAPTGEAALAGDDRAAALKELQGLQAQLAELQGEHPLILASVDQQAVGSVVSDWTGIPVGRMVKSEVETVMNLARLMGQRVR